MADDTINPFYTKGLHARKKVITVGPTDILLGRGKSYKNHPGNLRFQAIVNDSRTRYFQTASRRAKREISIELVRRILKTGRFLKVEKNSWKEVSFETARQKVAHAMQYRQRCSLSATPNLGNEFNEDVESIQAQIESEAKIPSEDWVASTEPDETILVTQQKNYFPLLHTSSDVPQQQLDVNTNTVDVQEPTPPIKNPVAIRAVSDVIEMQPPTTTICFQRCSGCHYSIPQCSCHRSRLQQQISDIDDVPMVPLAEAQSSEFRIPLMIPSFTRGISDFSFGDFSFSTGAIFSGGDDYNY